MESPDERDRVATLGDLIEAASDQRAVVVPGHCSFSRPTPAAFLANLPARDVHRMLGRGIYLFTREAEKNPPPYKRRRAPCGT